MTTSDIHIATENTTKSASQAEAPAAKAELVMPVPAAKLQDAKTKAPAKAVRKTVARKAVATPVPATTAKKAPTKVAPTPVAKTIAKPPAKARAKAAPKAETQQAAKPSAKVLPEKASKQKKPKLVRDSFTIPKAEYLVLDDLKQLSAKIGNPAKKSELLRAGIKALAAMTDAAFKSALAAVPTIKTGRPAKN